MPSHANKGRKVTLAILIPTKSLGRAIAFVDDIQSSHASWFHIHSILHAWTTTTVFCVCLCDSCCSLKDPIQRWTYRGECEEGGIPGFWNPPPVHSPSGQRVNTSRRKTITSSVWYCMLSGLSTSKPCAQESIFFVP